MRGLVQQAVPATRRRIPRVNTGRTTDMAGSASPMQAVLPLLLPIVVTLSILFVVYVIFRRMGGMEATGSPKPKAHGSGVPSKNPFTLRPSRFDTMGNLLTAWKPIDEESIVGEQEWMGERLLTRGSVHPVWVCGCARSLAGCTIPAAVI